MGFYYVFYEHPITKKMEKNPDFQSELMRFNGVLQGSITELRYRCEVYRLSLRSICKVLANVRKEHEIRLRCLNSSRPTFQTYLLNLSQKQALDRIGNVVRKASTFINGYSLVDKDLFQPPPPKPKPVSRDKRSNTEALTDRSNTTDASYISTNHDTREKVDDGTSGLEKSNSETPSKAHLMLKRSKEQHKRIKHDSSKSTESYKHSRPEARKRSDRDRNDNRNLSPTQRKVYTSYGNGGAEVRRARTSLEGIGKSHKTSQHEKSGQSHASHFNLNEIQESKNEIHYKARESLPTRTRPSTQGQGVARKYLFSSQRSHNNFKLNVEKIRRVQLYRRNRRDTYASTKPEIVTRNLS